METKIQIKSIFGEVKFEYECENNSIKKTVEHAVKKRINLSYSNLSDSNLSYSNLSGSNLRGSNLSGSNLRGSNLSDSNLSDSNLSYSNLSYSNLRGSNLSDSNLSDSNLSYSNLSGSNLRGSNLSYSNLSGSNLRGSNLSDSNLRGSNLSYSRNTESAYLPIFCKWSNSIIGNKIQIGCKTKTIEEWEEFFNSDEEFETKRGTDDFKQIQAVFESYKAYINFLNQ